MEFNVFIVATPAAPARGISWLAHPPARCSAGCSLLPAVKSPWPVRARVPRGDPPPGRDAG